MVYCTILGLDSNSVAWPVYMRALQIFEACRCCAVCPVGDPSTSSIMGPRANKVTSMRTRAGVVTSLSLEDIKWVHREIPNGCTCAHYNFPRPVSVAQYPVGDPSKNYIMASRATRRAVWGRRVGLAGVQPAGEVCKPPQLVWPMLHECARNYYSVFAECVISRTEGLSPPGPSLMVQTFGTGPTKSGSTSVFRRKHPPCLPLPIPN